MITASVAVAVVRRHCGSFAFNLVEFVLADGVAVFKRITVVFVARHLIGRARGDFTNICLLRLLRLEKTR